NIGSRCKCAVTLELDSDLIQVSDAGLGTVVGHNRPTLLRFLASVTQVPAHIQALSVTEHKLRSLAQGEAGVEDTSGAADKGFDRGGPRLHRGFRSCPAVRVIRGSVLVVVRHVVVEVVDAADLHPSDAVSGYVYPVFPGEVVGQLVLLWGWLVQSGVAVEQ